MQRQKKPLNKIQTFDTFTEKTQNKIQERIQYLLKRMNSHCIRTRQLISYTFYFLHIAITVERCKHHRKSLMTSFVTASPDVYRLYNSCLVVLLLHGITANEAFSLKTAHRQLTKPRDSNKVGRIHCIRSTFSRAFNIAAKFIHLYPLPCCQLRSAHVHIHVFWILLLAHVTLDKLAVCRTLNCVMLLCLEFFAMVSWTELVMNHADTLQRLEF